MNESESGAGGGAAAASFSLTRCPTKVRVRKTKANRKSCKTRTTNNNEIEGNKNQDVTVTSILEDLDSNVVVPSRIQPQLERRRRRRRHYYSTGRYDTIPIPTFCTKTIDLSMLDTPPEKERKSKCFHDNNDAADDDDDDEIIIKNEAAASHHVLQDNDTSSSRKPQSCTNNLASLPLYTPSPLPVVHDDDHHHHDTDDSDLENIPSSPIFCKSISQKNDLVETLTTKMMEHGSVPVVLPKTFDDEPQSDDDENNNGDAFDDQDDDGTKEKQHQQENTVNIEKVSAASCNLGILDGTTTSAAPSPVEQTATHTTINTTTTTKTGSTTLPVNLKKPVLDMNQLFRSLDVQYLQADVQSVTVKDIISALQEEFKPIKFDNKTRKCIKTRLTHIIAGKVQPMMASASASASTSSLLLPSVTENMNEKDDDDKSITKKRQAIPHKESNQVPVPPQTIIPMQVNTAPTIKPAAKSKSPVEVRSPITIKPKPLKAVAASASERPPVKVMSPTKEISEATKVIVPAKVKPAVSDQATKPPTKRNARPPRKTPLDITGNSCPQQPLPPRKRFKKGTCALCTTCNCSNTANNELPALLIFGQPPHGRGHVEMERSLIRRQKKLEKTVDKYESDLDVVTRALKRHRRTILKQREVVLQNRRLQYDFLPDVDEWDAQLEQWHNKHNNNNGVDGSNNPYKKPASIVEKAKRKLFGNIGTKIPKGGQITLTQMMQPNRNNEVLPEKDEEEGDFMVPEDDAEQEPCMEDIMDESSVFSIQEKEEEQTDMDMNHPADAYERVRWRDGKQEMTSNEHTTERHLWPTAGETATTQSAWDVLFTNQSSNEAPMGGFDELLDLFNNATTTKGGLLSSLSQLSVIQEEDVEEETTPEVTTSQLSQTAQTLADAIEAKVKANPSKLCKVENACPNWKENIRFALVQQDPVDIQSALENIQDSKAQLAKMKQDFLAAWSRKHIVMQLFELSLKSSLQRTTGTGTGHAQTTGNATTNTTTTTKTTTTGIADTTTINNNETSDDDDDEETVVDFSPLSQESPTRFVCHEPEPVHSSAFHEMTQLIHDDDDDDL